MDHKLPSRNQSLADLHRSLRLKFNQLIEAKAKNVQDSSRNGGHRNDTSDNANSVQPNNLGGGLSPRIRR